MSTWGRYGWRKATVDPCPMCGGKNVRWRNRRFLDLVFNNLRYGLESVLLGMGQVFSRARYPRHHHDPLDHSESLGMAIAHRYAAQTPRRYWRCPDCKRNGEVFDDVETFEQHVEAVNAPTSAPDDPFARH